MEGLSNTARLYRAQGLAAVEAFNKVDFEVSDKICSELLMEPDLPMLWRAKANFMLGTSDSNTAISHAREAVRLYQELLKINPGSAEFQESKLKAEKSLQEAESRLVLKDGPKEGAAKGK